MNQLQRFADFFQLKKTGYAFVNKITETVHWVHDVVVTLNQRG